MNGKERSEPGEQSINYRLVAAQDFEPLFAALRDMDKEGGTIGGTRAEYTGAQLIDIIQGVREGREGFTLDHITRTLGLKDKVTELLNRERQSKK